MIVRKEGRRQVVRIRDVPPEGQVVDMSWNYQPGDTRWAVMRTEQAPQILGAASQSLVCAEALPPEIRTSYIPPGGGAADLTMVVRAAEVPPYTGSAVADTNPAFEMQLHHPRFLEFIGAPESS